MLETALVAFTTFFATIGPLDVAALFAALTVQATPKERRQMALKGALIACVILLFFALFGKSVLASFGITLSALQASGGVLLLLIAIDMVFARNSGSSTTTDEERAEAKGKKDVSVFPLATPLIAGPGGGPAGGRGGRRCGACGDCDCGYARNCPADIRSHAAGDTGSETARRDRAACDLPHCWCFTCRSGGAVHLQWDQGQRSAWLAGESVRILTIPVNKLTISTTYISNPTELPSRGVLRVFLKLNKILGECRANYVDNWAANRQLHVIYRMFPSQFSGRELDLLKYRCFFLP